MCPEKAKVFIAEDDPEFVMHYSRFLKQEGHEIVGTASTKEDSLEATKKFNELGVQVLVLDREFGADKQAGEEILAASKANAPEVKIIGMSNSDKGIPGVNIDLGKQFIRRLGTEVTKL